MKCIAIPVAPKGSVCIPVKADWEKFQTKSLTQILRMWIHVLVDAQFHLFIRPFVFIFGSVSPQSVAMPFANELIKCWCIARHISVYFYFHWTNGRVESFFLFLFLPATVIDRRKINKRRWENVVPISRNVLYDELSHSHTYSHSHTQHYLIVNVRAVY